MKREDPSAAIVSCACAVRGWFSNKNLPDVRWRKEHPFDKHLSHFNPCFNDLFLWKEGFAVLRNSSMQVQLGRTSTLLWLFTKFTFHLAETLFNFDDLMTACMLTRQVFPLDLLWWSHCLKRLVTTEKTQIRTWALRAQRNHSSNLKGPPPLSLLSCFAAGQSTH